MKSRIQKPTTDNNQIEKQLRAEIEYLQAENKRLDETLIAIQTRHSRLLLYDNLTLPDARQIGINIGALVEYAFGDITGAQLKKKVKYLSGFGTKAVKQSRRLTESEITVLKSFVQDGTPYLMENERQAVCQGEMRLLQGLKVGEIKFDSRLTAEEIKDVESSFPNLWPAKECRVYTGGHVNKKMDVALKALG